MKRLFGTGIPAIALACVLVGCSDSGDTTAATTTSTTSDDALAKYAQCMRDNGVELPDPEPGNPGSLYVGVDKDSPAFTSANKVCGSILQGVVEDRKNQSGEDQKEQHDKLLALAQCLREHGVNVPDPQAGAEKPFGDSLDRTAPKVSEAIKECAAASPIAGGGEG
ncbi:hypothetical protein ACOBQX_08420 [Actinokineospora sp. G85]|uniref:hypothetical protein n=1 Tax=Actinokineospora sp. G85 TaxID=3406626 RepID=UPI003C74D53A